MNITAKFLRRVTLPALALVAVGVSALAFGYVADAQTTETADAEIDVDILVESQNPAEPMLVRVTVRAQRALSGELELVQTANEWASPYRIDSEYRWDIDVAANTEVETLALVATSWDTAAIEARLVDGDQVLAERKKPIQIGLGGVWESFGVIGIEAPGRVSLIGDENNAVITDLAKTNFTAATLQAFSTIAADPTALSGLEDSQRDAIAGWLFDGGQLALPNGIDDLGAAGLDELDAYRTGNLIGDGIVVPLGAPDQLIDDVLLPNDATNNEDMWGPTIFGDPVASMADRAGLELASLRSLAIFLGIYTIVAGPLAYAVCQRINRPRLMWAVLPGTALIFTAIAAVTSSAARNAGHDEHTTIVVSQPVGSTATSYLLARSGEKLSLDSGWWVNATQDNFGMIQQGPGALLLSVGPETTTAAINVGAGSASLLTANGPGPAVGNGLELVIATADAENVTGTVTNNLDIDLHDTIIMWGGGSVDIDTLAAGNSQPFTIEFKTPPMAPWGAPAPGPDLKKWGLVNGPEQSGGFDVVAFDGPMDAAIAPDGDVGEPSEGTIADGNMWMFWRESRPELFAASQVIAVGWTDELPSPAGAIASGRTAFVNSVAATGQDQPAFRMVNITGSDGGYIETNAGPPYYRSQYRVDFAEPIVAADWGVEISRSVAGLDFAIDGTSKWVSFGEDDDGELTVALPAELDGATSMVLSTTVAAEGPIAIDLPTFVFGDSEAQQFKLVASERPVYRNVPFSVPMDAGVERVDMAPITALAPGESFSDTNTVTNRVANVYPIDLNENAELTISMVTGEGGIDPYLEVRDPNGEPVASADDLSGTLNAVLDFVAAETGTYEIWAQDLGGDEGKQGYELTVTLNDAGNAAAEGETAPGAAEPPTQANKKPASGGPEPVDGNSAPVDAPELEVVPTEAADG